LLYIILISSKSELIISNGSSEISQEELEDITGEEVRVAQSIFRIFISFIIFVMYDFINIEKY